MTTITLKKSLLGLLAMIFTLVLNAQKTYLKITKSNEANDYVMYPPGTKFELKTKEGYLIFKNSDDPGVIEIKETYTLYVYPDWKDDADVFELTEGKVEKVLTSSYSETNHGTYTSNGVTANYNVTDSEEFEGEKNLEFKLSNGLTFIYEDKKYRAFLSESDNYVRIKGRYIISCELGTLKISFNEKTGKTWWVFENNNDKN